MDDTFQSLQDLTIAHGVPGYEAEIRGVMRGYLENLGEVSQDKLGSAICRHQGEGPRVMMVGHMDEIGPVGRHFCLLSGYDSFDPLV